ncbi:methyltransferase [Sphaerisporangium rufum]|uniref:Methyltransferase n=1 Tax=Sphaerisporangium rufum TaxID=1381558 RepID=A0A919V6M3_9ACTN|nr:class I SAM-dependent methyltransferase [Sphaerisporangium rufum]GII79500.1 methyltransferase [Sphaerisporangium rufum]
MTGPVDYDAELAAYHAVLCRAWDVRPGDRVLDIGCGAGRTTRDAARLALPGGALGVDASAAAVERARGLARAEGLRNVTFEHADAQTHQFAPGHFDLAISRFGTMFFADPIAAFGNIGRALRPGGRLVMLVWQAAARNEWDVAIRRALAGPGDPAPDAGAGPDPFSLADPATVTEILRAAGFAGVDLADVREPVHYGPDPAAALEWVRGFTCTNEALKHLDGATAAGALARLHDALAARMTGDGVRFDARAWLVTAHHR